MNEIETEIKKLKPSLSRILREVEFFELAEKNSMLPERKHNRRNSERLF